MIKKLIVILLISIEFYSCCTDKDCTNGMWVYFNSFNKPDIDSILLKVYVKNSNFTNPVDSSWVTYQIDSGEMPLLLTDFNHDYQLKIIHTGGVYNISNIQTKRGKSCNACFPYRPPSEYSNELSGYTINGQNIIAPSITISK